MSSDEAFVVRVLSALKSAKLEAIDAYIAVRREDIEAKGLN